VAGCATSNPNVPETPDNDPVIVQLNASGSGAFDRGSLVQAASFFEKALTRARAADHGADIGTAAYNLAACRMAQGRVADAYSLLREAVAEQTRAGASVSEAILLQARAARSLGREDEATALLESVLASDAPRDLRGEAALLKAEGAFSAGDTASAEAWLAKAVDIFERTRNQPLEAASQDLRGRLALQRDDAAAAAAAFDHEADAWRRAGRSRELAQALDRAADAWNRAGDAGHAAERWYRSGRSYFAQGDAVRALAMVESAATACEATGNEELSARLAGLFTEITAAVERSKQTASR
jgi:tetratricopeptide (TPR) repeat protein